MRMRTAPADDAHALGAALSGDFSPFFFRFFRWTRQFFVAFRLCFQLPPSFSRLRDSFSVYKRRAGVRREREKIFFRAESTASDSCILYLDSWMRDSNSRARAANFKIAEKVTFIPLTTGVFNPRLLDTQGRRFISLV